MLTPLLTRRDLLKGLGLAALTAAPACKRSPSPSNTTSAPTWPRTTTHEGIEMVELFPNGATESSPLIVFIHGMGGRPEHAIDWWSKRCPHKAHVLLPRAFDPLGDGYTWFEFRDGMTDEQFGAAVGAAEARLWRGLAAVAGNRHIIVTGFSQGGILSFAMASRHPDSIAYAFPISGSCPGPLLPKDKSHAAPLLAFHGTEDNVLALKWGREAVNAFKEQGNDAQIKEYAGVGHTITPQMRTDLMDAIGKALPRAT